MNKNKPKKAVTQKTTQNQFKLTAIFSGIVAFHCAFVPAISAQEKVTEEQVDTEDNRVVVTGTRIKKIDINNLSPITSISREDMDKFGYATVKDVIDGLSQNTGGTIDNSFTTGFTPGASSVNLRGIGFGHTLVLVDGRRLPIYPIAIGGTNNFVDLSSIPMAFVERIDVLTDGASAVYGSDAVSGVINVITRKEIEGISINYRYGDSFDGGYENHRFNLMTGTQRGDTQIDLILDLWQQAPLWATQRKYAASDVVGDLGNYSGGGASFIGLTSGQVYQHPGCGTSADPINGLGIPNVEVNFFSASEIWCGFDRTPFRQLIAPQKRASLMTRLRHEFSPDLSFFGRVGYSNAQTDVQLEPNFYGGALFNGFGNGTNNNGGVVVQGAANNPTTGSNFEESGIFVRRLLEFGARRESIDNDSYNLLAGLEGSISKGRYDWELGLSYNKTDLDIVSNNILLSGLNAAVENGLDLFETIPAETVNSLSFNARQNSYSTNRVIDFSFAGDLKAGLDAGPIQFALAIEQVAEKYKDQPDVRVVDGDAFGGASSGIGKRKHLGIGGELSFPFTDNFEMDIALRWDDYSDASKVNNAFSPRISLGYHPFESILTRFSWGKSFRAPDMQRLFGGATRSFIDLLDPEKLVDADGNDCGDAQASDVCQPSLVQSVQVFTLSNIDLTEEKGSNMNLGLIWQASEDFSMSLDYFRVNLKDVVATPSVQAIVNICSRFGELCELVERDSAGSLSSAGAYVATFAINLAEQNTDGIDLTFNYDWQNTLGRWSSTFNTTWVSSFNTRLSPGASEVDSVNLGALPEFRSSFVLDWHSEQWGATLKGSYIDEMAGLFCLECDRSEYMDSWTTFNLSARFAYNEFTTLRMGINNIANKKPPVDPTQTTWPWFFNDGGYYSAVGREFYLQVETRL